MIVKYEMQKKWINTTVFGLKPFLYNKAVLEIPDNFNFNQIYSIYLLTVSKILGTGLKVQTNIL